MSLTIRLVLVCSLGGLAQSLTAQCTTAWSSGVPQSELSGLGKCSTTWDPDGAGPLPERLVVGGQRLIGGSQPIDQRVMSWDGSQWESFGSGPGTVGEVRTLLNWNGLLVAGGDFTGGGTDHIALWSGSAWLPIGAGFPTSVATLAVWNGNLVAAGTSSGVAVIRTWNGATWTVLPTPPSLTIPITMVSYQGLLCVGGHRTSPFQGVLERWNGSAWATSITAQSSIRCLGVRVSLAVGGVDSLYAGGSFTSIGTTTASRIAATTGGAAFTWGTVGNGLPAECHALRVANSGLTGVSLTVLLTSPTTPVMRLNSSNTFVAMGNAQLNSLTVYGGSFHAASAWTGDDACQRYDGTQWVPVHGPGIAGDVHAATRLGTDMVIGGTFLSAAGVTMNHIARWDGTTFQPLGPGLTGTKVDALLTLDNGDVVAGGLFLQAGSTALNHMGRWDGTAWSSFGSGLSAPVLALCKMPNGDLIAGGQFSLAGGVPCESIARWNGSTWSPLGTGMNGDVMALAVRGDGVLFAGGTFTTAGGVACNKIAQWNGTAWIQVGAGVNNDVHALAVRPNGDVVAVGAFTSAGGLPADRCARWTGSSWASMGAASGDPTIARAVCVLPNGDVVAGRGFHEPTPGVDKGISRWNGSTWSAVDGGLGAFYPTEHVNVRAFALRADGDLIVGGDFTTANGGVSARLASLASTCPASVQPYGIGCSGAGPLVLSADTLPWVSATFRTSTTGLDPGSLCIGLIGLQQLSIPIDTLLPQGQPGCTLLTTLDYQTGIPNVGGVARFEFALGNDPSLIGVTFHEQTFPVDFDGGGAFVAIRSSNALAATIGTL
jgi:hypothetical protein